ncbi:hypothetical protein Hypma_004204 [Hypsizygus marmoreus]|uniref:Uncharacterized protein n=1 Tax=Hypsizygus marmoreus TaxID=39966 RepID=A0A369J9J7_HYPMA|nr:hypothetical protein Hypma_004204 [Hypsizygus marmoreus]
MWIPRYLCVFVPPKRINSARFAPSCITLTITKLSTTTTASSTPTLTMSATTTSSPSTISTSAIPTDTPVSYNNPLVAEILAYASIACVAGALIGIAIYLVFYYKRPVPLDLEKQNKAQSQPTPRQSRVSWASDSTINTTLNSPPKAVTTERGTARRLSQ